MYQGACLCGEVTVEISGPISSIIHCHCSLCRKSSGTAFATNGFVQTADFAVLKGAEQLNQFAFKPGRLRHFCRNCGSPVYSSNAEDPTRIRIRLGIINTDISERPLSHNFYSSKANWEDLDADLPRYNSFEPGRS
ncbi:MAG: GFA family protein [Gammaproteobacteria bacterium]|nr:GFA family protein [Gammaproteobacteria bacterium]MBU1556297.1 GFA family protein [Gammaproteobacteria bacterium]MBU2068883.1 GFA family protein [Gammaproteobacteria bacterium]MBU2184954.1 GFA family protein [Gammaproteobacteria bacterium]MBU2204215.1 GFA family protein [Gammaproteobacteria bacterium]